MISNNYVPSYKKLSLIKSINLNPFDKLIIIKLLNK
jgi:hypothetical protein